MKADDIMIALVAWLGADTALVTALGGASEVYRAGANRTVKIPSVEWQIITDIYDESTERLTIQWDEWARGYAAVMAIEARMRARLVRPQPITVGGTRVYLEYVDSRDHPDPEPGVAHRSLDILAVAVQSTAENITP